MGVVDEAVEDGVGDGGQLRLNFAYASAAQLEDPGLLRVDGTLTSGQSRIDAVGGMVTLTAPIPLGDSSVTLQFNSLSLIVRGRWRILLPVAVAPARLKGTQQRTSPYPSFPKGLWRAPTPRGRVPLQGPAYPPGRSGATGGNVVRMPRHAPLPVEAYPTAPLVRRCHFRFGCVQAPIPVRPPVGLRYQRAPTAPGRRQGPAGVRGGPLPIAET